MKKTVLVEQLKRMKEISLKKLSSKAIAFEISKFLFFLNKENNEEVTYEEKEKFEEIYKRLSIEIIKSEDCKNAYKEIRDYNNFIDYILSSLHKYIRKDNIELIQRIFDLSVLISDIIILINQYDLIEKIQLKKLASFVVDVELDDESIIFMEVFDELRDSFKSLVKNYNKLNPITKENQNKIYPLIKLAYEFKRISEQHNLVSITFRLEAFIQKCNFFSKVIVSKDDHFIKELKLDLVEIQRDLRFNILNK